MDLDLRHGNKDVAYRNPYGAGIDRFSPDLQRRRNLAHLARAATRANGGERRPIFIGETD